MTNDLGPIYTKQVKENFRTLWANWEPGNPIKLGDFGIMENKIFVFMGNIKDFGITFKTRTDDTSDHKFFTSKEGVSYSLNAKADVPVAGVINAKAGLEISFSKENSIFFNAAECKTHMIENKHNLGIELQKLKQQKKWPRRYVAVTDIIVSEKAIIAISGSNNSKINFEAKAPEIEAIDLADASLNLGVTHEESIGYKVDGKEGLVLLLGLCKFQSRFLSSNDKFKPFKSTVNPMMISAMQDTDDFQTEESEDDLYFGQYAQ